MAVSSEEAPLLATATATAHIRVLTHAKPSAPGGGSGGSDGKETQAAAKQRELQSSTNSWLWTLTLLTSLLLAACTRAAHQRGKGAARVQLQPQQQELTPFEQQLYGCRTFKSQAVPYINTSASLSVLDTHTAEQRRQAENFTAAVAACSDFACLRQANQLPRAPGQFRFPHFFVIGFPKCATTSIYCHLIQHPQVQYAKEKESHILQNKCGRQLANCSLEVQREYLVEILNLAEVAQAQMTKAAFDGSTHYVMEGEWLAQQVAQELPWVKMVVSLREPISQSLAMHLHNLSHNRTASCWDENERRVYACLVDALEEEKRARYGPKLAQWMAAYPRERLHILQYEALVSKQLMGGVLGGLKGFLEVDPHLPSDTLPLTNWKHMRGNPDAVGRYWNMTRTEYEHVVELARRNTYEVIKLLGQHGHADRDGKVGWMRNWDRVWQSNLKDNCEEGPQGNCKIVVS